jgi:hypothetical protein
MKSCKMVFTSKYIASISFTSFQLISLEGLVLLDLIQNVHTLFSDRPSTSPLVPPPTEEPTRIFPSGSFSGAGLPQSSNVNVMRPITRRLGHVTTLSQFSFSSLPSDVALESRVTLSPVTFPTPVLGLPSSNTQVEGVETNSQERVTGEVRSTEAVDPEALRNSPPPKGVSVPPTSVTEWRLRQSQLRPHPEAMTIPQSPPESVLSSTSEFPLSSATSLDTRMGGFPA